MDQTILIYQMDVIFGNPSENLDKIEQVLNKYKDRENKLLVLPELFLTGYHKQSIEEMTKNDESEGYQSILELSNKYQTAIFGSIAKRYNKKTYNTAILVNQGEFVGEYRKSHLFGPMGEKDLFTEGRETNVLPLNKYQIGPSICYDLRFPELYRTYRKNDANVLIIVAEWPIQRIKHWFALLKARAIENQMTIIACNRVGKDPDYIYGGYSAIIDSYGEVKVSAENSEEVVLEYILETEDLTKFRDNFNTDIDQWIV